MCRARCDQKDAPAPCDEGECPYPLSPGGEGALLPANDEAVYIWKRVNVVGPIAWDMVHLNLTEYEAATLLEKLYVLSEAHTMLKQKYPKVRLSWEAH